MRAKIFALVATLPALAQGQLIGNFPTNPAAMASSFAQQIAVCEAKLPQLNGETAKFLRRLDETSPGTLRSDALDDLAKSLMEKARQVAVEGVTEEKCRTTVLSMAKRILEEMPCLVREESKRSHFTKEFDELYRRNLEANVNGVPCIGVAARKPATTSACARESEQVVLGDIEAGSPAERAGLKSGDILLSVAGMAQNYWRDLEVQTLRSTIGDRLPLQIIRNGQIITANVEIGRMVVLPGEPFVCKNVK